MAAALKEEIDTKAMPPPPEPRVGPLKIMEAEVNALSGCLKVCKVTMSPGYISDISIAQNAVVKIGQIYGFYADTQKL